jgi:outer membrane protein TolC
MKRSFPTTGPANHLAGFWLAALILLFLVAPAAAQQAKTKNQPQPEAQGDQMGAPQATKINSQAQDQGDKLGEPKAPKFNPGALPPPTSESTVQIRQPADFRECVRVALEQSPILVKSALEIETKRLDVQDAWATFIPTIDLNSTYWFSQPKNTDGSTNNPFTISFATENWNPVLSGFEVKAKKEMVNIAVLAHLKVISQGLKRLGTDFLQLDVAQQQKDLNKQKQDIAKQNLEFFKTRLGLGQATQLDVQIAETKLNMAKAEEDKISATRNMIQDDIKFIMGLPFVNKLDMDVKTAKDEVLGGFSPADMADDKIRAYSFDLRMLVYEKRLQEKNIALSYVKMLPTFGFTFQTINSLSSTQQNMNKGALFYPGVNISMPLDLWTKGRDVSRNYKKMDQQVAQGRAKEYELMASVQKALSDYQGASADYNLANSQSELSRLQAEQSQYRYKTGQLDFDKYAADDIKYYDDAQKALIDKLKRDTYMLELKYLNGDLEKQFINVTDWEK